MNSPYDIITTVGVFTHGHVKTDGLLEIIKILKQDGILCFTIHEDVFEKYGFEKMLKDLTSTNILKRLELVKSNYIINFGKQAWLCVYKKL